MRIQKIISGGQTGVDRGALDAAIECGFSCGGWCPPGREAEDGPISPVYPLREMERGGYRQRTIQNVIDSDATLILYWEVLEGGTEQTVLHCIRRAKPYKLIDATSLSAEQALLAVTAFLEKRPGIAILNVAGPRESRVEGAARYARDVIGRLISA